MGNSEHPTSLSSQLALVTSKLLPLQRRTRCLLPLAHWLCLLRAHKPALPMTSTQEFTCLSVLSPEGLRLALSRQVGGCPNTVLLLLSWNPLGLCEFRPRPHFTPGAVPGVSHSSPPGPVAFPFFPFCTRGASPSLALDAAWSRELFLPCMSPALGGARLIISC